MDEKEDAMLEMALPETIEVGLCFAFFHTTMAEKNPVSKIVNGRFLFMNILTTYTIFI